MTITHTMVNGKADGVDATIVRPSDWNANHTITPDTIANILSDHNKAAHDALNVDADTLDGIDSLGFVKADGTVPLSGNWDVGAFEIRAETLESDVATGTAPLTIASTTVVANLNADQLDGNHASAFAVSANGVTNGDAHDHSGGDGAQVNHTTLSNIGTHTHAQIDTEIDTTLPGLVTTHAAVTSTHGATALATPDRLVLRDAAGRAAVVAPAAATDIALKSTVTADISTHAALTASHGVVGALVGTTDIQVLTQKTLTTPTIGSFANANHTHAAAGATGGVVDHVNLSNIGANTHAQVDTHITTTNPHSSTALATPDRLVLRDAAGRAAVVAPAAATDIALKSTVTADISTHAALTASHGVACKIAGITIGNYVGNNTQNRAIAHGLGAVPKWVRIIKTTGSWNYDLPNSTTLHHDSDSSADNLVVTAWGATNFYVGDAGATDEGANKTGSTYYWMAFT